MKNRNEQLSNTWVNVKIYFMFLFLSSSCDIAQDDKFMSTLDLYGYNIPQ